MQFDQDASQTLNHGGTKATRFAAARPDPPPRNVGLLRKQTNCTTAR
jgi:hypothetical protein